MRRTWLFAGILLAQAALTVATVTILPATAQDEARPVTVDQTSLRSDKDAARASAGLPPVDHAALGGRQAIDQPSRPLTEVRTFTKAELLATWETGWQLDQDYLAELDLKAPALAGQERARMLAERAAIEAGPETVDVTITAVEVGQPSAMAPE